MLSKSNKTSKKSKSVGKILLIIAVIIWFSLLILAPVLSLMRELFSVGLKQFFALVTTPTALFSFLLKRNSLKNEVISALVKSSVIASVAIAPKINLNKKE